MMRQLYATALACSLVASACLGAADGPIRLPVTPTIPQPMPAPPGPDAKIALAGDQWYVIDSKVECIVRGYPSGLVTVAGKKGPRDISAKFVDGNGTVEDRTYDGPHIYIVRAIGKGDCSLVITPVGVKTGADILVANLAVDSGTGPIPPPKPPEPKPIDPPTPAKSLRVFLVFESGDTITAAQRAVLYGKVVEDWLNANCTGGNAGWRRRDKDSSGEADPTMAGLWAAVQPNVTTTPCIAVERDGKVELINLEPTPAKMVEVLNTYKAGK